MFAHHRLPPNFSWTHSVTTNASFCPIVVKFAEDIVPIVAQYLQSTLEARREQEHLYRERIDTVNQTRIDFLVLVQHVVVFAESHEACVFALASNIPFVKNNQT